jgi:hypothetical protein
VLAGFVQMYLESETKIKLPDGSLGVEADKKTKASSFVCISAFAFILTNPMLSGVAFLFLRIHASPAAFFLFPDFLQRLYT